MSAFIALTHATATYSNAVVGQDSCIVKESFTVDEGAGTIIGAAPGTIAFDVNRGFYSSDGSGQAAIDLSEANGGAGGLDVCKTAFTLYTEVEKEVLQRDTSLVGIVDYLLNYRVNTTNRVIFLDPDNASGVRIRSDFSGANLDAYSRGGRFNRSHVPVVLTQNGGTFHLYIDSFLTLKGMFLPLTGSITEFGIGGRGTASLHGLSKGAIRNVALWTRSFINPSTHGYTIAMFGDSYAENGTYGHANLLGAIRAETPDGQTGATFDGSSLYSDDGMVPVAHAILRKAGIGVMGNRILHWAEGGSGIIDAGTLGAIGVRVDEAVSGKYTIPDYAVFVCGYNDLNNPVSDTDLSDGTYTAAYQTEIDKLTNLGTTVFVCNLMWSGTENAPNYTQARVTLINTAINALTGCEVIDMFTKLGGFDNTKSADGIHPDNEAHVIYGEEIAKGVKSNGFFTG